MPLYEYECEKCGEVTSFMEKMFERPRFFGPKRRCRRCNSKKLHKVISKCAGKVQRTYTENLNELKSMGNVSFSPPPPKPPWGDGPPPGGCPYENAAKKEKKKDDKKNNSPIIVR